MKNSILIILAFFSITAYSQEVIETKYYKKSYGNSEINSPSKAKYKRTTSRLENGRIVIKNVRIKDDFLIWSKSYLNDEPVGVWEKHFDNGKLMSRLDYDQELNYSTTTPDDAPYIDLYANKPMGEINGTYQAPSLTEYPKGFSSYFIRKMRYPDYAVTKRITGTVIVLISIDESGNTELISINKGAHEYLDLEAARLMKELPKWTPCLIDQKPSKVYALVPIRFMLG